MDLARLSSLMTLFCTTFPLLRPAYHQFKKNLLKSHRLRFQLKFLKDCKAEKVIPKSFLPQRLRNLDNVPFSELDEIILNSHIKKKILECDNMFKNAASSRTLLKNSVTAEWWTTICDYVYILLRNQNQQYKEKLNRKLEKLFENSLWVKKSNPELFENMSSYELTKDEKLILGFGLNFSIARKQINPLSIAESFINLEKNARETISPQDLAIAKGCVYAYTNRSFKSNVPRRLEKALRNLRSNNDIFITKADKANSIVILDKDVYQDKLRELLDDQTTYSKLNRDPTEKFNKNFNSKVKDILKDKPLILKSVQTVNPALPYLYGLVKTHKPEKPLRPIISSVTSVTYKLSKWLAKLLSPIVGTVSTSHIKNSCDLVEKLKSIRQSNFKLISFDVNSLFTKVPVHDLLEFLREILENYDLPIDSDICIKLLELCVLDNVFLADGMFYKQTFGFAMGNPLSPILSNIYMEYFESRLLPQICNFPIVWYRYVDDIICLWPRDLDPIVFLEELNRLVPSITFKIEVEINNSLPFLDTLIIRSEQGLKFDVYRKPMAVTSYVHYFSNHHISVKKSVFSCMFLRAFRICDPEYIDNEIKRIFDIGKQLCYPEHFIKSCHDKTKSKFFNNSENIANNFTNILTIPFRQELIPLVSLLRPLKINVVFKYVDKIRNCLIKNSPVTEKLVGVYSIPCKVCNLVYIGQTGKLLSKRIEQHKYNVRTAREYSALFKHQQIHNHNIEWEKSEIIYKCNRQTERLIVEACLIKKTDTMNLNEGLYKIDNLFMHCLESSKVLERVARMTR